MPTALAKNVLLSKTFWVNSVTLLVSVLTALLGSDFISEEWVLYITGLVLPIANIILRFLTDQPVSASAPIRR